MASGGIDFTTCSICLDTFKTPRMLLCGHSFCTDCLGDIFNGQFRNCPDCREVIPKMPVEKFPINYALVSAINEKKTSSTGAAESDICATHNLPKMIYCRGPNCCAEICTKCWSIDHSKPPHEVVPLEEELEFMRTDIAKNTDAVVDFQSTVQSLTEKLSKANSNGTDILKETESLVVYQLQITSERSATRLKGYKNKMLKLCKTKQTQIELLNEELKLALLAATDTGKRLNDLIPTVQRYQRSKTVAKQYPEKPANRTEPTNTQQLVSVTEIVSRPNEELGIDGNPYYYHIAASRREQKIFYNSDESKTIQVFDFGLRPLYSFNYESGEIEGIAVSGDGTLYVSYEQGEKTVTSAVDKNNGSILRNIHSSDMVIYRMRAFGNRVVIIYYRYETSEDKHLFVFDNETLIRSIEVVDTFHAAILSHSYVMYVKSIGDECQLMLINIDSSSSSESQHKRIQIEGVDIFSIPFWIPKPSEVDTNTAAGYIVIHEMKQYNNWRVYETDLDSVEDGAKLQLRKIPIVSNNKYNSIFFLSALGDNLFLCTLQATYGDDKMAVMKSEFN